MLAPRAWDPEEGASERTCLFQELGVQACNEQGVHGDNLIRSLGILSAQVRLICFSSNECYICPNFHLIASVPNEQILLH